MIPVTYIHNAAIHFSSLAEGKNKHPSKPLVKINYSQTFIITHTPLFWGDVDHVCEPPLGDLIDEEYS